VGRPGRYACRRGVETLDRGLYVPRYLGNLAGFTRACLCETIFPHSLSHEPLAHQLDGGIGPGVANAVEGIKDLTIEMCVYEWPRLWSGCVTVNGDVRPGNWHPF
jgi:hypothetical protein